MSLSKERSRSAVSVSEFLTQDTPEAVYNASGLTELATNLFLEWFEGDDEGDPLSKAKSEYFHGEGHKYLVDTSPLLAKEDGPALILAKQAAQDAFDDACRAYWRLERSFERVFDAFEPLVKEANAKKRTPPVVIPLSMRRKKKSKKQ
jgi:hypothetical protein